MNRFMRATVFVYAVFLWFAGGFAARADDGNILGLTVAPTSGPRGVVVKAVAQGSPCQSMLKPGDNIFGFDIYDQSKARVGGAMVNATNFAAEVAKVRPGMTVSLIVSLRSVQIVNCVVPAASGSGN